ncbi:MAG: hypothetical protein AB8H03_10635 [Saprospiraceae bacterium]
MKKLKKSIQPSSFLTLLFMILLSVTAQSQVQYEKTLQVKNYGQGFLLSWSTFSEVNTSSFTIERSIDGVNFQSIGSIQNKNEEDINEYQFKDDELGLKKVNYRLKPISKEGEYGYSKVVSNEKKVVNYFKVIEKEQLPNNQFKIFVNSIKEGELKCRFSTNLGEVVYDEMKPLQIGLNEYSFDLSDEPDGTYNVVFKMDRNQTSVALKKETKEKNNVAQSKSTSIKY